MVLIPKNMFLKYDVFYFNCSMDINKEQKIKAQEWVVMFDGQIKKSEKEIDAYVHHLEVKSQKNQ